MADDWTMGALADQDSYDPFAAEKFVNPVAQGLVGTAIGAVLAPGRALQSTEPITSEQMIKPAADLAMMTTLGAGAVPQEANTLNMGIKAYHSSPHDFDRFDLSKIGTGEGAQVYGHGLYFAENPAVSGQGGQYWNQFLRRFEGTPEHEPALLLKSNKFDRAQSADEMQNAIDGLVRAHPDNATLYAPIIDKWQKQLDILRSGKPVGPRTYEVDINAEPSHLLDWDKSFGQQGQPVQEALRAQGYTPPTMNVREGDLGKTIYRAWEMKPEAASKALNEAGIPGIKYLDEGSRNAQRPTIAQTNTIFGNVPMLEHDPTAKMTHNYVIFDPNRITIRKKYVVPGAIGAGGMGALAAQDQYQQE
jgi:hypothetical protein